MNGVNGGWDMREESYHVPRGPRATTGAAIVGAIGDGGVVCLVGYPLDEFIKGGDGVWWWVKDVLRLFVLSSRGGGDDK